MTRVAAWLWLGVILAATAYLVWRSAEGLTFRSDLMALLPPEASDPAAQRAQSIVAQSLSRQVVLLAGDPDRTTARAAAADLRQTLTASGLFAVDDTAVDANRIRAIGAVYAPYRASLLGDADRDLLLRGQSQLIANRALAQVYGAPGFADAAMLRDDPFLLLPSFFAGLPLPLSALSPDDGLLSVVRDGKTWVLIAGSLTREPYALDVQQRLTAALDTHIDALRTGHPALEVLRLGAVFFAGAGAHQALQETSAIGLISTIGTVLLVLAAYRALLPLCLSLLVIGAGVTTAFSASLLIFGDLHIGAMLFGVSLIGVAVDYSLQYCTETFTPEISSFRRLGHVGWGITLGAATTIIGYLTLLLAPFPGLRQVAVFSAIGLLAAWLTVMLWLPRLDRSRPARHGGALLRLAALFLWVWESRRFRRHRQIALGLLPVLAAAGLARFHVDDDVHHMQALSPDLVAQQVRLQTLIGSQGGGQVFMVTGRDEQDVLRTEESLDDRLRPLLAAGALAGYRSPARYVPSAQRQQQNRTLRAGLDAAAQLRRLGLEPPPQTAGSPGDLTVEVALRSGGALGFLRLMVLDPVTHVVMLDGVRRPAEVAAAAMGLPGVTFLDAAGSFSALLAAYRQRAMALMVLSAALMFPVLGWRYGWRRSLRIMAPPVLAVALTPGLRALAGAGFTFFDGIALVLVLSVGVDYAVFTAETTPERRAVTMLAVVLAAATALLSFGLLALSDAAAVAHFGASMLIGILLAAMLAPMARR